VLSFIGQVILTTFHGAIGMQVAVNFAGRAANLGFASNHCIFQSIRVALQSTSPKKFGRCLQAG
jgi:Na+/H+-translocating membrane pyrophosphatase